MTAEDAEKREMCSKHLPTFRKVKEELAGTILDLTASRAVQEQIVSAIGALSFAIMQAEREVKS